MKLIFESRSCNESFARSAVAAFVSVLDPNVEEISDIKTAVSEAVTNCIVHAYRDEIGKIYINGEIFDSFTLKEKFGVSDIPNWNGDDNQVMKGYILKAVAMWNRANLTEQITQKTLDNLLTALGWATEELTAEEAYHYYEKKR